MDVDGIIEMTKDFALAAAIVIPIGVAPIVAMVYFGEERPKPPISEQETPNIPVPFRMPLIPPM